MAGRIATMQAAAAAKWSAAKPVLTGLVIGLIAGPIISGAFGFQMRTSTAQAAAHAGIIEQQASFCAERARAATPVTAGMTYDARSDLARRWAAMPGTTAVDQEVVYACSSKLTN